MSKFSNFQVSIFVSNFLCVCADVFMYAQTFLFLFSRCQSTKNKMFQTHILFFWTNTWPLLHNKKNRNLETKVNVGRSHYNFRYIYTHIYIYIYIYIWMFYRILFYPTEVASESAILMEHRKTIGNRKNLTRHESWGCSSEYKYIGLNIRE